MYYLANNQKHCVILSFILTQSTSNLLYNIVEQRHNYITNEKDQSKSVSPNCSPSDILRQLMGITFLTYVVVIPRPVYTL